MERKIIKVIALLLSIGILSVAIFIFGYTIGRTVKTYKDVGGNVDIEYYLEVSEDSIWVENVSTNRVYGGTYSQLDSLITIDNQ